MDIREFTIALMPSEIPGVWVAQCLEWDVCTQGSDEGVCGARHDAVMSMIEVLQLNHEWRAEDNLGPPRRCPQAVWDDEWSRAEKIKINVDLEGRERG